MDYLYLLINVIILYFSPIIVPYLINKYIIFRKEKKMDK